MNIESIAEVKVLTQGYQAEYGRSSGLQITAVTKSGSNRFHGSALPHRHQLQVERQHLGQPEERRSEDRGEEHDSGLLDSAGRSASRAATTSCSSSTATNTGPSKSCGSAEPLPRADGARALGRLLAVARQQRQADSAAHGPERRHLRRQHHPGQPDVRRRPRGPQPLPDAQRHPGGRHQLQPGNPAPRRQPPAAAAGRPRRLPVLAVAARHRQVLRPA